MPSTATPFAFDAADDAARALASTRTTRSPIGVAYTPRMASTAATSSGDVAAAAASPTSAAGPTARADPLGGHARLEQRQRASARRSRTSRGATSSFTRLAALASGVAVRVEDVAARRGDRRARRTAGRVALGLPLFALPAAAPAPPRDDSATAKTREHQVHEADAARAFEASARWRASRASGSRSPGLSSACACCSRCSAIGSELCAARRDRGSRAPAGDARASRPERRRSSRCISRAARDAERAPPDDARCDEDETEK